MKLGTVLSATDLPIAELSAARLDGELYAVDALYSPIDIPNGCLERALCLLAYCQGKLIAEQQTAAWIWGARDWPPTRHELCASLGARARPAYPIRTTVREVVIDERDLAEVGGVSLTTPLRTILDLARFRPTFDADDEGVVARLALLGDVTLDLCRHEMNSRTNLPNKRRALTRLAAVLT